jgi:hypothetical protein
LRNVHHFVNVEWFIHFIFWNCMEHFLFVLLLA